VNALGLGDRINPIVVKELRQAVQSKFVVAVLLLFLLFQVSLIGFFLVVNSTREEAYPLERESGGAVFAFVQSILLITCMLFIPLYTGFRLAAERSDTNVDLLFITTLPPRAVVWGKSWAALVLALLIFSACAPFMAFSYLLRGIDMPSILLVLAIDFLAVAAGVQLAIFVALIPTNRVFKAILGLLGFAGLVLICYATLSFTVSIVVQPGLAIDLESRQSWAGLGCIVAAVLAIMGLLFSWSVALISPPSANRALGVRVAMLLAWLATGVASGIWTRALSADVPGAILPVIVWLVAMGVVAGLAIVIAVNEREEWGPRVARTIPRRWWLRGPSFLFTSGAASGVTFGVLLFGLTGVAAQVWKSGILSGNREPLPAGPWGAHLVQTVFEDVMLGGLYVLAYALTAVPVRRLLPQRIPAVYTWIVFVALVAVGSVVPYVFNFLLFFHDWRFENEYPWLLSNPVAGFVAVSDAQYQDFAWAFFAFAGAGTAVAVLLNGPWFVRQLWHFRPRLSSAAGRPASAPTLDVFPPPGAVTKTAGRE
jgi:hypothetical protein